MCPSIKSRSKKTPEINQSNVLAKDSGKSDRSVYMASDFFQLIYGVLAVTKFVTVFLLCPLLGLIVLREAEVTSSAIIPHTSENVVKVTKCSKGDKPVF